MRKTLSAWRSTSSAPMYTSHSSPSSAAAVAVASPCALGLGDEPPHLVGILAAGLRLDPRIHVDPVRMRRRDRASDVLGREARREDDPPPLSRQVAGDRPLDRLARLAFAPARGA